MRATHILFALGFSLAAVAQATEKPLNLPFHQVLDRQPTVLGWHAEAAPGNELSVEEGALKITALNSSQAYLRRQLGIDLVRAESVLKPDADISCPNAVVLYWNETNWCRIAAIAINETGNGIWYKVVGGGGFTGDEMVDGKLTKNRLGACYAHRWHRLAIELGEDCLRYQTSVDGTNWVSLRTAPRPQEWRGKAPALLLIGKVPTSTQHPVENLTANQSAPRSQNICWVREVSVVSTPHQRLRLTSLEQNELAEPGRDWLGEAELTAKGGPTFESVSRHFPDMLFPRELLGLKDHPQAIGVAFDGSLQLKNIMTSDYADPKVPGGIWQVGDPLTRLGWEPGSCKKSLLNGWMPILVCRWEHDGLQFEQTAFGYSEGLSVEKPLFAYCRMEVTNPDNQPRKCSLRFRLWPAERAEVWDLSLAPKCRETVFVKVPWSAEPEQLGQATAQDYQAGLNEVTNYWNQLLARRMVINTPESRVNHASKAWEVWNFLNVHKRGEQYHINDGTGFYDELYGYSAANQMRAHDLMGYHEEVEKYLEANLKLVNAEGVWITHFGLPDSPTLLMALADHYRLTGNAPWLRSVAPSMLRMCHWIVRQRAKSTNAPPVAAGLIYYRPYADHPEPAYSYFSDTSLCVAMESTAEVLKEIGLAEDAEPIATESAAYRKDILRSMDAAIVEHEGRQYLPIFPVTQSLLKSSNYRADDYYGAVAGPLLETCFLDPAGKHVQLLMEAFENRHGLSLGCLAWRGGTDHAYLYGYLLNALKRNEPDKAVLGLYGWMAYGTSRQTHSSVELNNHRSGDNNPTLPHSYSGACQLLLLRNMLVREDGSDLLLGQAIPRHWIGSGKKVEIRNAPTFFGPVSYFIDSSPDGYGGAVSVKVEPPSRKTPKSIKLSLRHPSGFPIQTVSLNGEADYSFNDESIVISGTSRPFTMLVTFRNPLAPKRSKPDKPTSEAFRELPPDLPLPALPAKGLKWTRNALVIQPWAEDQPLMMDADRSCSPERLNQQYGFNVLCVMPPRALKAIGGGVQPEDEFKRGLSAFRNAGFKIMLYTALSNVGHDPLWYKVLREHPEWRQVNPAGNCPTWLCPNSAAFDLCLDYTKKIIADYGADAVLLDNNFFGSPNDSEGAVCYCQECQRKFRAYVAQRFGDLTEELLGVTIQELKIPVAPTGPLYSLWKHFRNRSWAEATERTRRALKDVVVVANTQYWWWTVGEYGWGVGLDLQYPHEDMLLSESYGLPGMDSLGVSAKMVMGQAAANGRPLFDLVGSFRWDALKILKPPSVVKRQMSASLLHQANLWICSYGLQRHQETNKPSCQAMSQMLLFRAQHANLYERAEPWGTVGSILPITSYNSLGPEVLVVPSHIAKMRAAGYAPRGIYDSNLTPEALARFGVLVAEDASCLTPRSTQNLFKWIEKGGTLIATGDLATYDEIGRRRPNSEMAALLKTEELRSMCVGKGRFIVAAKAEILNQIRGLVDEAIPAMQVGNRIVETRPYITADKHMALHVANHGTALLGGWHVQLPASLQAQVDEPVLYLPEQEQEIPLLKAGNQIQMPAMDAYGVIRLKRRK